MRIVAHVDMDAFYASVEERLNPALRGRPVVVGADPKGGAGRGVVTAASYAARKYGIRSALPISRAWRLAEAARRRGEPEAVFVRDNRQAYREASTRIMALIADGVDAFEGASIDEAYVDLSSLGGFDEARRVSPCAQRIEAPSPTVFRRVDVRVREGRRWPRGDRGVGARRAEHPGDARRRRCLVALGPLRRLRRGDAQRRLQRGDVRR